MCGLVGIVGEKNPELIRRMTASLAHRGPDGEGYYVDDGISLGHRRLAIIDLTHGGQPMISDDGRYVIIFNGEIYNHALLREELERQGRAFHTRCDTEVILQGYIHWGEDVVTRLRGMFTFAVWDKAEQTCFLARDHMGIKPLYYGSFGGRVYFASEPKAIVTDLRVPREPDLQAIDVFLTALMFPADLTPFKGIRQLEAGHCLTVRDGRITIRRYYEIAFPRSLPSEWDEPGTIDRVLAAAEETVKLRQMSDVPIGVFLSGGVDSSLVTALLARNSDEPVRTFSLVHKGDSSWLDESEYIHRVVQEYGTQHTEIESDPDWYQLVPEMIVAFDQPCTTSLNSYMVSRLAAAHVKVVLTGTGGDETFAGYGRYQLADPGQLRKAIAKSWVKALLARLGRGNGQAVRSLAEAFSQRNTYFNAPEKGQLYRDGVWEDVDSDRWFELLRRHFLREGLPDGLSRCLHTDQMLYLINNLHNNLDKVSMAHGLEARVPLCDYRFVEFANTVPSGLKLHDGELKYALKEAACRVLPREIIYRRKRGFGVPLKTWMQGPFADKVRQIVNEETMRRRGLFAWPSIEAMFQATSEGRADHSMRLWMLMTVELWYRMYIDSTAFMSTPSFQDLAA